jgi:hypothetical protein
MHNDKKKLANFYTMRFKISAAQLQLYFYVTFLSFT